MPIYEYECGKCGKTIEVIQKFSDPVLKKHQGCGGKLSKLISSSGFQFKGTGWYVTDYARKSQGSSESSESKESKESKKESSPKSDTKDSSTGTKGSSSDKSSSTSKTGKSGDS